MGLPASLKAEIMTTHPPSPALPASGPTLKEAIALAAWAHQGQIYPSPERDPYILHPLRVMPRLETSLERLIAVLHDVVEDTTYTLDDLRRLGYPEEMIVVIDLLTRQAGEDYTVYIERLISHPTARRIKLADLEDNLFTAHRLPDTMETRARVARYSAARARITAAETVRT
jgi:(p)ppGpp synthase/HD superfamily hydrolase